MIIKVEAIEQPMSGKYEEKLYKPFDNQYTSHWIWIKFTDENFNEWCGQFLGRFRGADLSKSQKIVFVATEVGIYTLDAGTGKLLKFIDLNYAVEDTTVSDNGTYLISLEYSILVFNPSSFLFEKIELPRQIESAKFLGWKGSKLTIDCIEFLNANGEFKIEYDEYYKTINFIGEN